MKKLALQISLTILATCSGIFVNPQSASAQVDMSLLTEVAKSCQKDAKSAKYYKQMGFDNNIIQSLIGSSDFFGACIYARYSYSLVQSKFPWLVSTGNIMSGYPGSVAVSLIVSPYGSRLGDSSLLDCIVSQDPSNDRCRSAIGIFYDNKIRNNGLRGFHEFPPNLAIYMCPSCVVAHDNVSSEKRMIGSFIQWFLKLDKPTRRKVMSILGDDQEATTNRSEMILETRRALAEYREISRKVAQEEQDRRRREVIGN